MLGPWINAQDNVGFMALREWELGELFENVVFDN